MELSFNHEFFEDEIRDGFYVPSLMKRAWAGQLEVLSEIDKICKKHKLRWYADFGTLLGAVRHKGFIPWDDDVDICMPREDYELFTKYAREELPDEMSILTAYDEDPYYEFFNRVVNTRRLNYDKTFLEKYHQCPFPLGIDVFPIDYISKNQKRRKDQFETISAVNRVISGFDANLSIDYESFIMDIEALTGYQIDKSLPVRQKLYICFDQVAKSMTYDGGEYVTSAFYYSENEKYYCRKKAYDEIAYLDFENFKINAPLDYDAVLTCEFKNYWRVIKGTADHEFPFFVQFEQMCNEKLDYYPFMYHFDKSHIENESRERNLSVISKAEKFAEIMKKAHHIVYQSVEENTYDIAFEILESCQNSAISIGNQIEEAYANPEKSITILEDYCELLYGLYNAVGNEELDEIKCKIDALDDAILRFLSEFDAAFAKEKEILFLVFKDKYWDSFDALYKEAVEKGNRVYAMVVPYYEINADNSYGDMHIEDTNMPEYVNCVGYKDYDIAKRHPDMIYIQNPYDECNYSTRVPDEFFAQNLKGLTDELIYKPYFTMDELDEEEKLQYAMLRYFCSMPGVVHSDKIILDDENTKKGYIEYLTKMSGEEYRGIWENKIL